MKKFYLILLADGFQHKSPKPQWTDYAQIIIGLLNFLATLLCFYATK